MMTRLSLLLLAALITLPAAACPRSAAQRAAADTPRSVALFVPVAWATDDAAEAARTEAWVDTYLSSLSRETRVDLIAYEPGTTWSKHSQPPAGARLASAETLFKTRPLWRNPKVEETPSGLRHAIQTFDPKLQNARKSARAYVAIAPRKELEQLGDAPLSEHGVLLIHLDPALKRSDIDTPRGSVLMVMPEPGVIQRAIEGRVSADHHPRSILPMLGGMLGTLWFLMGLFAFFVAWLWQRSRRQQLRHSHEGL